LGAEGVVFHQMGEHRLERASEDSIQERFAGAFLTGRLGEERVVEIGSASFFKTDRSLFHQAGQVGLGGLEVKAGTGFDLCGVERVFGPENLHDSPFGIGNTGRLLHEYRVCLQV
jgi:hypothetical protein